MIIVLVRVRGEGWPYVLPMEYWGSWLDSLDVVVWVEAGRLSVDNREAILTSN